MKAFRHLLSRLRHARRGVAAAEFALIVPIMVVCLVAVYDLGRALQQQIRLNQAVEAGGMFAIYFPRDSAGMSSVVSAAVSSWTNVTVATPSTACFCYNATTSVSTSVTCTFSTRTDCGGTSVFRRYISIGASRPVTPIFFTTMTTTSVSHVVQAQ
jgi:Flp pilus assembly protein TadG